MRERERERAKERERERERGSGISRERSNPCVSTERKGRQELFRGGGRGHCYRSLSVLRNGAPEKGKATFQREIPYALSPLKSDARRQRERERERETERQRERERFPFGVNETIYQVAAQAKQDPERDKYRWMSRPNCLLFRDRFRHPYRARVRAPVKTRVRHSVC